ncbi:SEC10/PgrA surface exclusion domain-containing protein, partial [Lactobacillus sp. AN1001]
FVTEGKGINVKVAENGLKINNFKHSTKDESIIVTPTNLTFEQQKGVNIWIAGLLNGVRQQFGFKGQNIVTVNSIKYANTVAENYWDKWAHDLTALEKAEKSIGGVTMSSESIGWGYIPRGETTLDNLKNGIYNSLLSMIFDDAHSNWGHARQLTGMYVNNSNDYFGFSVDKNSIVHFENYEPMRADNSEL